MFFKKNLFKKNDPQLHDDPKILAHVKMGHRDPL